MTLTTTQLRAEWGPNCATASDLTRIQFLGVWVTVRKECVDAYEALAFTMAWHGWRPEGPDTGAMNCRQITGGDGLSLHSFGIAIDCDWLQNPYGTSLVTNMSRAMVDDILAIRTKSGHRVWRWGGDWDSNPRTAHTYYDAMHYEVCCSRDQLASGIANFDFSPVPDPVRPPTSEEDNMTDAQLAQLTSRLDVLGQLMVGLATKQNGAYALWRSESGGVSAVFQTGGPTFGTTPTPLGMARIALTSPMTQAAMAAFAGEVVDVATAKITSIPKVGDF